VLRTALLPELFRHVVLYLNHSGSTFLNYSGHSSTIQANSPVLSRAFLNHSGSTFLNYSGLPSTIQGNSPVLSGYSSTIHVPHSWTIQGFPQLFRETVLYFQATPEPFRLIRLTIQGIPRSFRQIHLHYSVYNHESLRYLLSVIQGMHHHYCGWPIYHLVKYAYAI